MFFIRIMGPVIGFMMGSFFNKFYYTSNRKLVFLFFVKNYKFIYKIDWFKIYKITKKPKLK